MLDTISLLRTLSVIPLIKSSDQISSDATNAFEWNSIGFAPSAAGASIVDNSVIAADRISVYRMIDASVTDASFFHVSYNTLKSSQVFGRITVQFYIGNMTGIGKSMVWSFNVDLLKSREMIIDRNMEAVGVVFTVGNSFDNSVSFSVRSKQPPS